MTLDGCAYRPADVVVFPHRDTAAVEGLFADGDPARTPMVTSTGDGAGSWHACCTSRSRARRADMWVLLLGTGLASADPVMPTEYVSFEVRLGVRSGAPGIVTDGSGPQKGDVTFTIHRGGGSWSDCVLVYPALIDGMAPVDVSSRPALWPDAAWHLTLGPATTTGFCTGLDDTRWGADPAATVAAAGWSVGLGPATPMMRFWGAGEADPAPLVTLYAWMDGADPYPIGLVRAWEIDASGALTGSLLDVSTAATVPDAWFEGVGTGMFL